MIKKMIKKRYLIIGGIFLLFAFCAFGLKSYSDVLVKEGTKEFYDRKNRKVAIEKIRLAQTIWPPLRFDKSYQYFLGELKTAEQRAAVYIYPEEDATSEDIGALVSELEAITGVREVKFISRDDVFKTYLETFKQANKNEPSSLELSQTFLPQLIEVYLDDFTVRNQVEQIAKSKFFVTVVTQGN